MEYMTVKEDAEKWGISLRSAQTYCTEGKIEGATKFGKTWAIPVDAQKPADSRKKVEPQAVSRQPQKVAGGGTTGITGAMGAMRVPMPLLNTPFERGHALAAAEAIEDEDLRNIAIAEYYYFSGNSQKAAKIVEKYLDSKDLGLRLSACWIYAYASLSLDKTLHAKKAMASLQELVLSINEETPKELRSIILFVSTGAAVLLHLPLKYEMPPMADIIGILPPGLRLFALYVYAHYGYLTKEYAASAGVAETALALEAKSYPIPAIYLHLVAVMDYVCLKRLDEAKRHLLAAWEIAKEDNLIQAFGEHHGLLGGMLEAVIKKQYPEEFKKMIAITYKFSAGWRKIHNPHTGNNVADTLTTSEFAVSMLISKDYTTKEIAALLGISENTVKYHVDHAMAELGVSSRKELKRFMLA